MIFKKFLSVIAAYVAIFVGVELFVSAEFAEAQIVQLDENTLILQDALYEEDSATFELIVSDMIAEGEKDIQFLINSPGGDSTACHYIMNRMIELQKGDVVFTTVNLFDAYSAGGFIWLMGKKREALHNAQFMFHTAVWLHPFFGLMPWADLPEEIKEMIREFNYKLRQTLLTVLRDTELVNELLSGGYGVENYYTNYLLNEKGLIDRIL